MTPLNAFMSVPVKHLTGSKGKLWMGKELIFSDRLSKTLPTGYDAKYRNSCTCCYTACAKRVEHSFDVCQGIHVWDILSDILVSRTL